MARSFALRLSAALFASLALASPARSQLPSPSAAGLGLGDNLTTRARGFEAVAWNPAALGLADVPTFSLAIAPVRLVGGLDPVTLSDLAGFDGRPIPAETREEWLAAIEEEGSQQGVGGGDLTYLALSVGRVGFQFSSSARAVMELGPAAAELILFGNAGRTGEPREITLDGSSFDLLVTSTAALSYAQPLPIRLGRLPNQFFAIGATLKYTIGNLLLHGEDAGTRVDTDPLQVALDFPVVQTDTALEELNSGRGVGLDLAAAWQAGSWRTALVVQNVVSTFEWDADRLFFRPGQALFTQDTTTSDFDARPIGEAPAELTEFLDDRDYSPVVALGISYRPLRRLVVSADLRRRFGAESFVLGPRTHVGVGVEFRPVSVLPLRAGGAFLDGGFLLGAGAGLALGPVQLSVSGARRETDLGTDAVGMATLSFGLR